ncbi:hypothetical protein V8E51_002205 [Hyaloscypha variabilis]
MNTTAGNATATPVPDSNCKNWNHRQTWIFVFWVLTSLAFAASFVFGQQVLAGKLRKLKDMEGIKYGPGEVGPLCGGTRRR